MTGDTEARLGGVIGDHAPEGPSTPPVTTGRHRPQLRPRPSNRPLRKPQRHRLRRVPCSGWSGVVPDIDDGCLDQSDHFVGRFSTGERTDFARADREKASCVLHPCNRQEVVSTCGPQEVDLELGCHNLVSRGRLRQRGIATRAVDDACDCASVNISVLLGNAPREG